MYNYKDIVKVYQRGRVLTGIVTGRVGDLYSVLLSTGFQKLFSADLLTPGAAF